MHCPKHGRALLCGPGLIALLLLAGAAQAEREQAPGSSQLAATRIMLTGASRAGDGLPTRFRRQAAAGQHRLSPGQLAALSDQAGRVALAASEQALIEADEQALKRQLPDLIAQAHNDKTLERALLRLVINASLRGSNSMQAQQQQQLPAASSQWQLDNLDNAQNNNLAQYNQANSGSAGEFGPIRLARLDSNELAGLESQLAAGELAELPTIGQLNALSAPIDKREYIKPCSFNAISCVRTPFRKLRK